MSASALVVGVLIAAPAQAVAPAAAAKAPAASTSAKYNHACGAATTGHFTCFALHRTDVNQPSGVKTMGV